MKLFATVLVGASVAAGGIALAGGPVPISPSFERKAQVECRYVSRGDSGAADNELRISGGRGFLAFVTISDRSGKLRLGGVRRCEGRSQPELNNIDSIAINFENPEFAFVQVDMARSALGPGATRESDGSSEIEISVDKLRGSVELSMGGADDFVTGEEIDEDAVGANLTAGEDSDIDVRGSKRSGLAIAMGDGDDRYEQVVGPRARGIFGPPSIIGFVRGDAGEDVLEGTDNLDFFDGGSGADTISGGPGFDYLADGEDDDLIIGEGGSDWLEAYGGRDEVEGGGGRDVVFAGDKRRDRIDCGENEDLAFVDRGRDVYEACEKVRRGPDRNDVILLPRLERAVDRAREFFKESG